MLAIQEYENLRIIFVAISSMLRETSPTPLASGWSARATRSLHDEIRVEGAGRLYGL